jgi:hypothetical protein
MLNFGGAIANTVMHLGGRGREKCQTRDYQILSKDPTPWGYLIKHLADIVRYDRPQTICFTDSSVDCPYITGLVYVHKSARFMPRLEIASLQKMEDTVT